MTTVVAESVTQLSAFSDPASVAVVAPPPIPRSGVTGWRAAP